MTKQEKIIEAYGEYWDKVKEYVDKKGWCNTYWNLFLASEREQKPAVDPLKWRPKSLQGIEKNNGWTKIESESDVPKTGYYELIERESGKQTRGIISNDLAAKESLEYYSHYQAIEKILKPIY